MGIGAKIQNLDSADNDRPTLFNTLENQYGFVWDNDPLYSYNVRSPASETGGVVYSDTNFSVGLGGLGVVGAGQGKKLGETPDTGKEPSLDVGDALTFALGLFQNYSNSRVREGELGDRAGAFGNQASDFDLQAVDAFRMAEYELDDAARESEFILEAGEQVLAKDRVKTSGSGLFAGRESFASGTGLGSAYEQNERVFKEQAEQIEERGRRSAEDFNRRGQQFRVQAQRAREAEARAREAARKAKGSGTGGIIGGVIGAGIGLVSSGGNPMGAVYGAQIGATAGSAIGGN